MIRSTAPVVSQEDKRHGPVRAVIAQDHAPRLRSPPRLTDSERAVPVYSKGLLAPDPQALYAAVETVLNCCKLPNVPLKSWDTIMGVVTSNSVRMSPTIPCCVAWPLNPSVRFAPTRALTMDPGQNALAIRVTISASIKSIALI